MRYRRTGDTGFSYNNTGFDVTLDQLAGLTREQVMSSTGTNVHFQLKRDAGTFNFEGWFKARKRLRSLHLRTQQLF